MSLVLLIIVVWLNTGDYRFMSRAFGDDLPGCQDEIQYVKADLGTAPGVVGVEALCISFNVQGPGQEP
jgi:hypothetical protein